MPRGLHRQQDGGSGWVLGARDGQRPLGLNEPDGGGPPTSPKSTRGKCLQEARQPRVEAPRRERNRLAVTHRCSGACRTLQGGVSSVS